MEVRELDAKQVAECIENYQPVYERSIKRNRRNTILVLVGLLLVYFYLRLFNTGFSIEGGYGQREVYSTAWIVNCPPEPDDGLSYWWNFEDCPYMRVLNVEEGVTKVDFGGYEENADRNYLHTVKLPSTVKAVNAECFKNCTNLKTVKWERTAEDTAIGVEAFRNTGIEEFHVPDGVTSIMYGAFEDNSLLEKVILPDSVCKVDKGTFRNCENLQEVTWSASLEYMPEQTFLGCENLSVLNNTKSLRSINYDALIGTQIPAQQLPENVHCYKLGGEGVIMNTEDIPWLADYNYTYNAEEDVALLAEKYDLPLELFELKMADGKFWLDGEFYSLGMTLDEFVKKGDWTISDIYENKDDFPTYCLVRETDEAEVSLDVDNGEIVEYRFYFNECKVILPDGVNNFGMLSSRIPYLYGEDAVSRYEWEYTDGNEPQSVSVTANYDWRSGDSEEGCTITVSKSENIDV